MYHQIHGVMMMLSFSNGQTLVGKGWPVHVGKATMFLVLDRRGLLVQEGIAERLHRKFDWNAPCRASLL